VTQQEVQDRILQSAYAALKRQGYISPIEVLVASRMLQQQHVEPWRRGRIPHLDNFSSNGDPAVEKLYLTNYLSAAIPEPKQKAIKEKLEKPEPPTVFDVIRPTECSECGIEIWKGGMIYLEQRKALCLACARMNDLEYLPAGDTALTRRATKHSSRCGRGALQPLARTV